jgi:hypothetical protein
MSGRFTFIRLLLRGVDIRSLFFQNDMKPQRGRLMFQFRAQGVVWLLASSSIDNNESRTTRSPILQPPDIADTTPRRRRMTTFHLPKLELSCIRCAAARVVMRASCECTGCSRRNGTRCVRCSRDAKKSSASDRLHQGTPTSRNSLFVIGLLSHWQRRRPFRAGSNRQRKNCAGDKKPCIQ